MHDIGGKSNARVERRTGVLIDRGKQRRLQDALRSLVGISDSTPDAPRARGSASSSGVLRWGNLEDDASRVARSAAAAPKHAHSSRNTTGRKTLALLPALTVDRNPRLPSLLACANDVCRRTEEADGSGGEGDATVGDDSITARPPVAGVQTHRGRSERLRRRVLPPTDQGHG